MRITVGNADDVVLDYLVATLEGLPVTLRDNGLGRVVIAEGHRYADDQESTGKLIDREGIETYPHKGFGGWAASCDGVVRYGPTRLVAALRTLLCLRLGQTAEVPDDLVLNWREHKRQMESVASTQSAVRQEPAAAGEAVPTDVPTDAAVAEVPGDASTDMTTICVLLAEGDPLDWMVAQALGQKPLRRLEDVVAKEGHLPYLFDLFHDIKTLDEMHGILAGEPHCSGLGAEELRRFCEEHDYVIGRPAVPAYSRDWAVGGPLKSLHQIGTVPVKANADGVVVTRWIAGHIAGHDEWEFELNTGSAAATELTAAMRVLVVERLGHEVQVPRGLLTDEQVRDWHPGNHRVLGEIEVDGAVHRPRSESPTG